MSWFVFTEDELQELIDGGHRGLAEDLRQRGRWTEHETLLVKARGPESFVLVGAYSKYPRRMARDPPMETRPSNTPLSEVYDE
jgi:hypothetical protein